MQIINGIEASKTWKAEIKALVDTFVASGNRAPHLAAILVGKDGGSLSYVENKIKGCKECGFDSTLIQLDANITEQVLLDTIDGLNNNAEIDGFIVQLPLPKHIDEKRVLLAIKPSKDVDGFHPENVGRMALGLPTFLPATPAGILRLFEHFQIETKGKHAVILGRSHIVGSPMAQLLLRNNKTGNCTVTVCHSHTPNLSEIIQQADILIAAIGKPEFVSGHMVKDGVIVIDVGTTRVADAQAPRGFRLKGDVNFDEVSKKALSITPVPGGVGPMTIASLLFNTWQAASQNR